MLDNERLTAADFYLAILKAARGPVDISPHKWRGRWVRGYTQMRKLRDDPNVPESPRSDEDLPRYLRDIERTPLYRRVMRLMRPLARVAMGDVTRWSEMMHQSQSGQYIPRRQRLHQRIIEEGNFLNSKAGVPEGQTPVAIMLMGVAGAGKSSAGSKFLDRFGRQFSVINPDIVREMLPEYKGWNSAALHAEASRLTEEVVFPIAVDQRHNIVLDVTGRNTEKMVGLADALNLHRYEVHVVFVEVPTYVSVERAWKRFVMNAFRERNPKAPPGRLVPPSLVYGMDNKPAVTFEQLKNHPAVRSWIRLDNSVPFGTPPRVVEEGVKP